MAVGLSIEKHLCHVPRPPHHTVSESDSCPSEWSWLASYATTVQTAEAIASGTVFPESFIVSQFQELDDAESALVSCDYLLPAVVCLTNDLETHQLFHDICLMRAISETFLSVFRTTVNGASRWMNN